ncbi:type II toxin-antitoxin system VapC family toxin [Salinibacterium sp. dk2585]|uniref:PIN domain-containing protein n=1 Tax=unclassified Salinibacterium TaxID=2632331 RepID=UPI0011C24371|nr:MULTISPECIES: PIN domain-containing protein [unclassified Salinibacterium]QEE60824.1 type II toxin-antitoxin system VapC family toxin [Salinibacterium sp. dk2585]TXK55896.1 type II toxin-antitoxin system VapC family toxin [Salinibacterium sp. dk5596]
MTERAGLLDTSVLIAVEQHRSLDHARLPLQQHVSVISRGELYAGVHASQTPEVRAARLATLESIAGLSLLAIGRDEATEWGRLRYALAAAKRRVNVNDLWIAAIAVANGLPVITQDDDFDIIHEHGGPAVIKV